MAPPLKDPRDPVAARIVEEMVRQEKRQRHAATVLGMSRSGAGRKLRGDRKLTPEDVLALADWLGVPVTQFLRESVGASS